jgi:hypothetical protein
VNIDLATLPSYEFLLPDQLVLPQRVDALISVVLSEERSDED